MIAADDIVREARGWLGTRWRHQGYDRRGCDCIGLIGGVALACDVPGASEWKGDASLHAYGRMPDPRQLIEGCERFMDPVDPADLKVGDVVVFILARDPQHFGLISSVDPLRMIHSIAASRRVVEHVIDDVWRQRLFRAYRMRGVTHG